MKKNASLIRWFIIGIFALGQYGLAFGDSDCLSGGPGLFLGSWIDRATKISASTDKDIKEKAGVLKILSAWQEVNTRVGNAAGNVEPLIACYEYGINAYTIGTQKSQSIRITIGLLDMLGADKPLIAALLGHEYAHLVYGHGQKTQDAVQVLEGDAARTYQQIRSQDRMWGFDEQNRRLAKAIAQERFEIRFAAYSRIQEIQADEFGIALARKAGYPPSAFDALASLFTSKVGQAFTELKSSHPGWLDRQDIARPVIADEEFTNAFQEVYGRKDKKGSNSLLRQWIQLLPNSGKAWYYKSILLGSRTGGIESMELAIASQSPQLKIEGNVLDAAYLWLCTSLFAVGHKSESAICAQYFLYQNEELKTKFLRMTFGESLQVAGNFQTIHLASVRDANGHNLITSDFAAATNFLGGADPIPMFPWRPGRFQSCADFDRCSKVKRDDHDYDLSVRPREEDPFEEVRKSCAQPLCRQAGLN